MASTLNLFHLKFLSTHKKPSFFQSNLTQFSLKKTHKFSCKNNLNDADLALSFANEVEKIHTKQVQKETALEKSRELLFKEMCEHFDMKDEELKRKWKGMSDDEKLVFVKGFVEDWGEFFYPLSVGAVKDMVDEHLDDEGEDSGSLSGFKKFWKF